MFFSIISYHTIYYILFCLLFFFFFQAEDGIRDKLVTGVQTCALPISMPADCCWCWPWSSRSWSWGSRRAPADAARLRDRPVGRAAGDAGVGGRVARARDPSRHLQPPRLESRRAGGRARAATRAEIGRAHV